MEKRSIGQTPAWRELTPGQQRVIRCIRRHGPLTREQIGTRLAWPASSVSREISPLLAQDAVFSDPPGTRRRNALLSGAPTLGYAIGVEIGFERVRAAIVDFNGRLAGTTKEYRPDRRDAEAFLRCVQKVLRELLIGTPLGKQVMGIGIGFADRASWNPVQAFARDRPASNAAPLVESIQTSFELPVVSRTDAACAALGEWRSGQLRGVDDGLFLLYEQGIGLGIIANGRVVYGGWNDAGEIGHIPIDDNGDYCQCGNIGCLETIAAEWALRSKAKQIVDAGGHVGFRRVQNPKPQVDELCAMAISGDLLARNMLSKAGRGIGRALAISASLFDPAVIVLGGALSTPDVYEPLITPIRETFQSLTAHRTPQPIRFESSALGRDAVVIGAAELVFGEVLG
jgi:predicted NBD/HSP70 family sugar kinase